jgi:hypothetical protein
MERKKKVCDDDLTTIWDGYFSQTRKKKKNKRETTAAV